MVTVLKWITILGLLITLTASSQEKVNETLICVKWQWTGDVFNRKVYCVEWVKKDCSKRLYKDLCKLGV
jgi:hypothetical protein